MVKKATSKKVATRGPQSVVAAEDVPEFLRDQMDSDRGSEEVSTDDLTIPRISVVQSLSKVRDKNEPSYIEGITEGELFNSVTKEVYGDSVIVVPVYFRSEYVILREYEKGGGFGGRFESMAEARRAFLEYPEDDGWEIVDTAVHFAVTVTEDGDIGGEACFYMSKSQMKVSRNWNSMIRMNRGPRFSRQYLVSGVPDSNAQGQKFYNISMTNQGFVSEEQFDYCEKLYENIKSGRIKVSADTSDMHQSDDGDTEDGEY